MPDRASRVLLVGARAETARELEAAGAADGLARVGAIALALTRLGAVRAGAARLRLVIVDCSALPDADALPALRAAAAAATVPVVALCEAAARDECAALYRLGIAACVALPAAPAARREALAATLGFWLEINELPSVGR